MRMSEHYSPETRELAIRLVLGTPERALIAVGGYRIGDRGGRMHEGDALTLGSTTSGIRNAAWTARRHCRVVTLRRRAVAMGAWVARDMGTVALMRASIRQAPMSYLARPGQHSET